MEKTISGIPNEIQYMIVRQGLIGGSGIGISFMALLTPSYVVALLQAA